MTTQYHGASAFPDDFPLVDDGSSRQAADVNPAFEALGDRTVYLLNRSGNYRLIDERMLVGSGSLLTVTSAGGIGGTATTPLLSTATGYTLTSAPFTVPAIGTNVSVTMGDTSVLPPVGEVLFIGAGGGLLQVVAIVDGAHATLKNVDVVSGSVVGSGAHVFPANLRTLIDDIVIVELTGTLVAADGGASSFVDDFISAASLQDNQNAVGWFDVPPGGDARFGVPAAALPHIRGAPLCVRGVRKIVHKGTYETQVTLRSISGTDGYLAEIDDWVCTYRLLRKYTGGA